MIWGGDVLCRFIAEKRTGTRGIGAETAPIGPPAIMNNELPLNDPHAERPAISVRQKRREEIAEVGSARAEVARALRVAAQSPWLS